MISPNGIPPAAITFHGLLVGSELRGKSRENASPIVHKNTSTRVVSSSIFYPVGGRIGHACSLWIHSPESYLTPIFIVLRGVLLIHVHTFFWAQFNPSPTSQAPISINICLVSRPFCWGCDTGRASQLHFLSGSSYWYWIGNRQDRACGRFQAVPVASSGRLTG